MRETIAFLLLACACGAAAWSERPNDAAGKQREAEEAESSVKERAPDEAPAAEPRIPRGDPGARPDPGGFLSLEARAPSLAPGMRLAAEREGAGERTELVRAAEKDTCARVAFEASAPVIAKLFDGQGGVLAQSSAPQTEGELGELGPVCVRKGDRIEGGATGATVVRWIAWALP